jgi:CHAT domain-containing protein/Tfp pilus assembly protein PilF
MKVPTLRVSSGSASHAVAVALLLGALVLSSVARAQSPPAEVSHQRGKLTVHHAVEREMGPGRADVFTIKAVAGRFFRVVVEKKGVDAIAVVEDPAGKVLITADGPNGAYGPEPASLIADQSGYYRITVRKSPRSRDLGRYRIELTDLRLPLEPDRIHIQAERELYAATLEERAQDKEALLRAIDRFQHAAALWHGLKDGYQEALCLQRIGAAHYGLGETREALDYYNQALTLQRAAGDRDGEAATLRNAGLVYVIFGENQKALDCYSQSLSLCRAVGDRGGEASVLMNIGTLYSDLGEDQKALDHYNQKLRLDRASGNRSGEAGTLNNIGIVYSDLGEKQKALDYFNQALPLQRATGRLTGEAHTLGNLGLVYSDLGEKQKALEYYTQTLPLWNKLGDIKGESLYLLNIGRLYADLGEGQKALDYFNQALPLERKVGDRSGEAIILSNIGRVYSNLGEKQKALEYYNLALPLQRSVGERRGEATTLSSIGSVYRALGDKQKALDYYTQALPLRRSVGDRAGEADTLSHMGQIYTDLGQQPKALAQYLDALRLARAVADPLLEGDVLNNLMRYWEAEHNSALATFFGKQAVNQHQQIRRNIQNLDQELQRSYLSTVNEHYRHLADLLIAQGRLSEAEQVLGLLKSQEYLDYVRGGEGAGASVKGRADLTPEEAACEKRYLEIADKLVAIGAERGALLTKSSLTPEETRRLDALEKDVATGNMEFERFLGEAARDFSAKPAAALRLEQLKETQGIMEDLRELPPGTVAIYTLVGEDKFWAILRTPDAQKAYEYPITAADLNRKVLEFRQVVRNPDLDPRPLAQELYRILVGPMAEDLRQAHAQTLMWELDGILRYVPLAALYDGKQYLVEQYRVSVITLASNARLKDKPDAQWKAAGFGVTKAFEGSVALPSVSAELSGIIAVKAGDAGVLRGEIELDDQFTQRSMRETLRKHYAVVHIASHFQFQPGNETQSFLLLGDGGHLSLAELKTSASLFGGVQLLTLSACNTGMGDGAEVEGFGALAQLQGAKAVIATLWPVADVSTSLLMQEFYRIREAPGAKTKLEALQEAQLELLRGDVKAERPAIDRALVHEPDGGGPAKPQAPPFSHDPKAPFAHPYYWAPFFLMGNWL